MKYRFWISLATLVIIIAPSAVYWSMNVGSTDSSGFWQTISLILIVTIAVLALNVHLLTKNNWLFTYIDEGRARLLSKFGQYDRTLWMYSSRVKLQNSNQILSNDELYVDKTKKLTLARYLVNKNKKNSRKAMHAYKTAGPEKFFFEGDEVRFVDSAAKEKELKELKTQIYFTLGYGRVRRTYFDARFTPRPHIQIPVEFIETGRMPDKNKELPDKRGGLGAVDEKSEAIEYREFSMDEVYIDRDQADLSAVWDKKEDPKLAEIWKKVKDSDEGDCNEYFFNDLTRGIYFKYDGKDVGEKKRRYLDPAQIRNFVFDAQLIEKTDTDEVRDYGHSPHQIFGSWFWVGFGNRILTHHFRWTSQTSDGKMRTTDVPRMDYVSLKLDQYVMTVKNAEIKNRFQVTLLVLIECECVEPKKAILNVEQWLEMLIQTAQTMLRGMVANLTFDEINQLKTSGGGDLSRTMLELVSNPSPLGIHAVSRFGIRVRGLRLANITAGKAYQEALTKEGIAYQEARATVRTAKGEARAIMIKANAAAEARKREFESIKAFEHGLEMEMMRVMPELGRTPGKTLTLLLGSPSNIVRSLAGDSGQPTADGMAAVKSFAEKHNVPVGTFLAGLLAALENMGKTKETAKEQKGDK